MSRIVIVGTGSKEAAAIHDEVAAMLHDKHEITYSLDTLTDTRDTSSRECLKETGIGYIAILRTGALPLKYPAVRLLAARGNDFDSPANPHLAKLIIRTDLDYLDPAYDSYSPVGHHEALVAADGVCEEHNTPLAVLLAGAAALEHAGVQFGNSAWPTAIITPSISSEALCPAGGLAALRLALGSEPVHFGHD